MLIRLLFSHYLKNLTFHLTFSQFVLVDIQITRTRRHHNHRHLPSRFHYFCYKLPIVYPRWDPAVTRKSFFSSTPKPVTRGCFSELFSHQARLQNWILARPSPHFAWHAFWGTFALGLRCSDLQPCLHTQICRLHNSLLLPPLPRPILGHRLSAPWDRLIQHFGFSETQIYLHRSHLKLCLIRRLEVLALFWKLLDLALALSDPCLLVNGSCPCFPCFDGQRLQQPAFLHLLRPQRCPVHLEFDLAALANLDSCHLLLALRADLVSFLDR